MDGDSEKIEYLSGDSDDINDWLDKWNSETGYTVSIFY
jgi:hypothetical protein